MRLSHLHLPGLTPYLYASRLQELLIQRQFGYKDAVRQQQANASAAKPAARPPRAAPVQSPLPTVLTFSTPPTYTVGRRYLTRNPIPESQIAFLRGMSPKPNVDPASSQQQALNREPTLSTDSPTAVPEGLASFYSTARGGNLTYHGPGQLVAYPIIDLRAHGLSARCYIRLLEETVMRTCVLHGVGDTQTTDDPGVWMGGGERKICAVGVQVRRATSGHGIGLNVRDEAVSADEVQGEGACPAGYLSWGFGRIVACGLEGKTVTWMTREGADPGLRVDKVAITFVQQLAQGLGLQPGDVDRVTDSDLGLIVGDSNDHL